MKSDQLDFEVNTLYLDVIKKKRIYFHYHQKYQDITDKRGDIELDLILSRQNTLFT